MINQTAYELEAARLSGEPCPDCGLTHDVSVECDDRGVVVFSAPSAGNCPGFNRMVSERMSRCANLDGNTLNLLRRFLGDPSL